MNIIHVVGARPNFMKASPVFSALSEKKNIVQTLVHTGQHYDDNMSKIFFDELGMPSPDINLSVGSGSHAVQTAEVMIRFEEVVNRIHPDLILVYGDVNSTLAASLVCSKLGIPVGHVEAGLRSFDRAMPEEINRLITDQISDWLFTPSEDGNRNLIREGIPAEKIYLVGNVMIDTLVRLQQISAKKYPSKYKEKSYVLVTLHRPSNVDESGMLRNIMETLAVISKDIPVIFPIHPRTRQRLASIHFNTPPDLKLTDPVGYLEFLSLQQHAAMVITDSGGIQEETTFLGVPCLTVRNNTERPITVELGTNILVGQDMEKLKTEVSRILNGNAKKGSIPPLWDGKAGERIADIIDLNCKKRIMNCA